MEATKERPEQQATKERPEQQAQERRAAGACTGADSVQLPTETSPYVQYKKDDDLEDYKMRAYGARGHLPVSDLPHGGTGTDAPTVPGTAVPAGATAARQPQRGDAARRADDETVTDTVNRHGVP